MSDLASRTQGKRYVVHLNGTGPTALMEALHAAGIRPERVRPADPLWEEVILSLLAGEQREVEERR